MNLDLEEIDQPTVSGRTTFKSKVMWWCDPREWLKAIIRQKDTPHSIALGTAIGLFVGITPTFGIQMLIVLLIAFLARPFFRFNRFAALVAVYISNPFTMVPLYWINYQVGTLFTEHKLSWSEFVDLFEYASMKEWWNTFQNVFYVAGLQLVIGSLIVATFVSLPTYPLMLRLIESVQRRRKLRRAHKEAIQLTEQASAVTKRERQTYDVTARTP